MISEKEVIWYKGVAIRHIVSDCGLELVFRHTQDTGAPILIKPTLPAIGGCRDKPGMSIMEACEEVYGLSNDMAAKHKCAGLNGGGAKTVVISKVKNRATLRALGEFVEYLHSIGIIYIISVDSGYTPEDMRVVAETTQWVSHCNPSPDTARGVAAAILAYADMIHTSPKSLSVFVRGLGEVGRSLALILRQEGFIVFGCDKYLKPETKAVLEQAGVQIVPAIDDWFPKAHIYAPCSLGGEISDLTIPRIQEAGYRAIMGSSNRLCKQGEANIIDLHLRGILIAISHVSNRCGLLRVAVEFPQWFHMTMDDFERAVPQTGAINRAMFEMSQQLGKPMTEVEKIYFADMPKAA